MIYQAPISANDSAGMQARLQIAGVSFNKAMGVSKRDIRAAAESQEAFDRLVKRLKGIPDDRA